VEGAGSGRSVTGPHRHVPSEREVRIVVLEVGEDAPLSGARQRYLGTPRAVTAKRRMKVEEAGQVAAGQDQVQASLVLDLVVGHRVPVFSDPEAEGRCRSARQRLLVERERHAAGARG